MIEQLRERRSFLISTRTRHVCETQQYQPGDEGYDRDEPSFVDAEDLAYYHKLRGHIDECTYLIALFGKEGQ